MKPSILLSCLALPALVYFSSAYAVDAAGPATLVDAPAPPVEAFASPPQVQQIKLSPDGKSLAYVLNQDGSSYLITQTGDGTKPRAVLVTDNKKYRFQDLRWVNNTRLLAGVLYPDYRYGRETTESRMLALNSDGSKLQGNLLESAYRFDQRKHVPQYQNAVLGNSAAGTNAVLVALDIENPTLPDVYSLDVDTARLTRVAVNAGGIHQWLSDRQGNVRAGSGWRDKDIRVVVRAPGSKQWQTLAEYPADDYVLARQRGFIPLGFDDDPRYLYGSADYHGRSAIFKVDTSDPALPRTLVYADANFDVHGNLVYSKWLKRYVGVDYASQYGTQVYWDEQARALQQQLDGALPGKTNRIAHSSDDGMRLIVSSSTSNTPARYYWLDRTTGKMHELAKSYPALEGLRMPAPHAVQFQGRDGTPLHGYLTPPWHGPATNAPLVVLPHGGPFARDVARFDIYTQFLASRGWAVLQVNFRGSTGYGAEFEQAGLKRWGLEMQDDITDGVQWAIRQGLADAQRVCIVGASYGGYAALMGVVKTPDLYRCGISINGVSDLRELLANAQGYIGYEIGAERQIGRWWGDREQLRQTSPVNRAREIRTPLLLIHGEQDRIVQVDQSRDMADALKDAGHRDYQYLELPLGDHSLSRQEDRLRALTAMEAFLKRYLDAPTVPQHKAQLTTETQNDPR